jgi:hypothetical protein
MYDAKNRDLKSDIERLRLEKTLMSERLAKIEKSSKVKPMQVQWRITDIANKLKEAEVNVKSYNSPKFDVYVQGNQKLYMSAEMRGMSLGLYLHKDAEAYDDQSCLAIGGTSFSITVAGISEIVTFDVEDILNSLIGT